MSAAFLFWTALICIIGGLLVWLALYKISQIFEGGEIPSVFWLWLAILAIGGVIAICCVVFCWGEWVAKMLEGG